MSKIIFEKFDKKDKELKAWTSVFDNTDELLRYMSLNSRCLLGDEYKIIIRSIKERNLEIE